MDVDLLKAIWNGMVMDMDPYMDPHMDFGGMDSNPDREYDSSGLRPRTGLGSRAHNLLEQGARIRG